MEFTDWKSLTNLNPTERRGTIQDTPCAGFQWKYSVLAEYDQQSLGFGSVQREGRLVVQILSADLREVLFEQEVRLKYQLVTLDFGGMVLFTWNVDLQNWRVTTTIPAAFETLGGEQPYTDPGGGSDYSDHNCIISFDYYSGLYLIPLPEGAVFKVKFHNEGMAGLRFVPVQTRTIIGGGIAAYHDEVGIHRIAKSRLGYLGNVFSLDGGRNYESRRIRDTLASPCVSKLPDNTLLVSGKFAQADWRLLRSQDDGLTWLEGATVMWPANYQDVKIAVAHDGAILTVARNAGSLYCRSSRDGYVSTYLVGAATKAFEVTCHPPSGRIMATDGTTAYVSDDDGLTWMALEVGL